MVGSRRNAATTASRRVVSATRSFAVRIAGDIPVTATPTGTMAARRERIAAPTALTFAGLARAADPTGGAPSAPCRNVTISPLGVAAGRDPRARCARRAFRILGVNEVMLGRAGSAARTVPPTSGRAATTDATRGGTGTADAAVMTPLIVPVWGIQPVSAGSLLQPASVSARATTTARGTEGRRNMRG